ncbi:MAG: methylmalonyl Co-A mutase-associated GTPase MeaB [Rhodobacteraceae bacterium]|nr:methylmalonyl Co-A mutase-associated GTPase MeaB [Paracoccaceae bacterium]MCY4197185.1 methylmalonyl Co-A mutase-associated GTPase MeaB [Paracoccaceae bacterium]MCY4327573.1 methylmalonyl Co-A mutase-associated GTPase MeaB [Paracoccaceae bacterium]
MHDCFETARKVRSGNRRALSRAITLAESSHPAKRAQGERIIDALAQSGIRESLRIGLTGPPGVGKSSLLNRLGSELTKQGKRVAVLAIDPSSPRTGGSILGDKTRMDSLIQSDLAFIRPSPAAGALGGVAESTREVTFLCEQAGFDMIFVETTGVGQSEVEVAELTDIFVLLVSPGSGDELQAVKRGIMEIADLIAITKSDGDLRQAAERTCAAYHGALRLFGPRKIDPDGIPCAMNVSSTDVGSLMTLWQVIEDLACWRQESGNWRQMRIDQEQRWVRSLLRRQLLSNLESCSGLTGSTVQLEAVIRKTGTVFSPDARAHLRATLAKLNQITATGNND